MEMNGMDPNGKSDPGKTYKQTDVRNVKVAMSYDSAHDFGVARRIGDFNWHLQACPTIGPAVWWNRSGSRLNVAWFTGATHHVGVWYAESSNGGVTFSPPVRLTSDIVGEGYDLAAVNGADDSVYVGWGTADEHVQVARIDRDGSITRSSRMAGDRVALTALPNGTALVAYAAHNRLVVRSVH
jgi:hypothetical protein